MVWETRQNRLRSLVDSAWVFQVFAFIDRWPIPLSKSIALKEKHNLYFKEIDRFDFPKKKIGVHEFDVGYISQTESRYKEWELLYTSLPYSNRDTIYVEADAMAMKRVYRDVLSEKIEGFAQYQDFFSDDEGCIIDFDYRVYEYSPKLFPSDELGRLHPYTLIKGHSVKPEGDRYVNFDARRPHFMALSGQDMPRPR